MSIKSFTSWLSRGLLLALLTTQLAVPFASATETQLCTTDSLDGADLLNPNVLRDGDSGTGYLCRTTVVNQATDYFGFDLSGTENAAFTVENTSNGDISVYINDVRSSVDFNEEIASGDSYTFNLEPIEGAEYSILVRALERPSYEHSYNYSLEIEDVTGADLAVAFDEYDPETNLIHYTAFNRSSDTDVDPTTALGDIALKDADGNVLKRVIWNNMYVRYPHLVDFLEAGGSKELSFYIGDLAEFSAIDFGAPGFFSIEIDSRNRVIESDEGNNSTGEIEIHPACSEDILDAGSPSAHYELSAGQAGTGYICETNIEDERNEFLNVGLSSGETLYFVVNNTSDSDIRYHATDGTGSATIIAAGDLQLITYTATADMDFMMWLEASLPQPSAPYELSYQYVVGIN